ncbi:MAG: glycine--tRNA ligase subunit beta [Alphaproteobacteria bacterium]|nr:glycine--tRNA ligase subunit beta [Alphaproteobacteria bacterium]
MAEFLLELFSEEIPARMQAKGADDLRDLIVKGLEEKGLTFTKAEAHSTPRRITVVVDGLPMENNPPPIDKKGPRVDAAQQALDGFLKSIGQSDFSKCVQEESPKGTFWYYREAVKGQPTAQVLSAIVEAVFEKFVWPKSMRWKAGQKSWVRPLRSIVALFDGAVVPLSFALGGGEAAVTSGKQSQGHRFLSSGAFEVKNFADYTEKLKAAHVILSRAERKAYISAEAQKLAAKEGLKVNENDGLMEEIVGLVEWPVPLVGTFEKEFLEVPQEVLISTMRGDQKYIALLDNNGKLANKFVVIANTITEDGGKNVVAGNEKVLRARLSDAKFFWDQDRKQKLESRVGALGQITFHQKLGTVKDKVSRLEKLAAHVAKQIGADEKQAARAALLAKADLTSGVVFQFPEVQGIMGRYYALHDKETPAVAQAIADHYKPVGANDTCPNEPLSICTALADKLDTLAGFFAIDEKPTGSKDPFALRRAALGIIRIVLENNLRLPLVPLFEAAYNGYAVSGLRPTKDVTSDLVQFFTERLKVALKDQGIRHDLIDAVLAADVRKDDIALVVKLVQALRDFVGTDNGANLLAAYKRGANILRIEEKKDGKSFDAAALSDALLKEQAEKDLAAALVPVAAKVKDLFAREDYTGCMAALSELRAPVDAFFDKIMVNAPEADIRANRLSLLSRLRDTMNTIADFSKTEG